MTPLLFIIGQTEPPSFYSLFMYMLFYVFDNVWYLCGRKKKS